MRLHNLELFGRKFARFIEYFGRYGNFTYVVQGGRGAYHADIPRRNSVLIRLFNQTFQKHLRNHIHVQNVQAALAVSELDYVRQNFYHKAVVLFLLINLLRKHVGHLLLPHAEREVACHAVLDGALVERSADIVHRPQIVRPVDISPARLRRNHYYGRGMNPARAVHHRKHGKPVHLRHNYIEQHKRNFQLVPVQNFNRFQPVFRFDDIVLPRKHIGEYRAVKLAVVND